MADHCSKIPQLHYDSELIASIRKREITDDAVQNHVENVNAILKENQS
jgi:hypothetical protein